MSLTMDADGRYIHYPTNKDKFEFDNEVAVAFNDMAIRSIPGYKQSTNIIAYLIKNIIDSRYNQGEVTKVGDLGCSTGALYKELWRLYGKDTTHRIDGLIPIAVDTSQAMIDILSTTLPNVTSYCLSAQEICTKNIDKYNVIVLSYVAQFVSLKERSELFGLISDKLDKGGILFISEKEKIEEPFDELLQEMYIEFRMRAGYSQEEIKAKTIALSNSMWPQYQNKTFIQLISSGFLSAQELFRWGPFSTYMYIKK